MEPESKTPFKNRRFKNILRRLFGVIGFLFHAFSDCPCWREKNLASLLTVSSIGGPGSPKESSLIG